MVPSLNIYAWMAIAAIAVLAAGGLYYKVYRSGADSVAIKQEKALNELKDRTDAVQDRALTTTSPRDELRKYARPDDK